MNVSIVQTSVRAHFLPGFKKKVQSGPKVTLTAVSGRLPVFGGIRVR
jgi:hypothetical protein